MNPISALTPRVARGGGHLQARLQVPLIKNEDCERRTKATGPLHVQHVVDFRQQADIYVLLVNFVLFANICMI